MELPRDILDIIREYSMPVTRPDWRKLHKYTNRQFYSDLKRAYNKTILLQYGYYYYTQYSIIHQKKFVLLMRVIMHNNSYFIKNKYVTYNAF